MPIHEDLNGFLVMMQKIVDFLRIKWTIWGFSFSILEVWFYGAMFELLMAFIWQIFGQIPHALNRSEYRNGYKGGINNGKSGSHKSSTRKLE